MTNVRTLKNASRSEFLITPSLYLPFRRRPWKSANGRANFLTERNEMKVAE